MSETMEEKNKLLVDISNITDTMNDKNEKRELEIRQYMGEIKKTS